MLNHTEETQQNATEQAGLLGGVLSQGLNRRKFLQAAGITAGAAGTLGLAGCTGIVGVDPTPGPAPSIADILNFALNLEYFEASYYLYVTTGSGLQAADMGPNPGTVTGGVKVTFTDPNVAALAQQLAADEQAHVRFLRAGLQAFGITPVSMPSLNLAAGGTPTGDSSFLAAARQFETVGTSAYEGGVGFLAFSVAAVNYAALIHIAEGEHEAVLRQFCIAKGIDSPAVDQFDRAPVLNGQSVFNTSPITGLNTARNASEVLQVLYAAPGKTGVSSGGFFPNGLNGNVKTT